MAGQTTTVLWLCTYMLCMYTVHSGDMHMGKDEAMSMLKKYNYMNTDQDPDMTDDEMYTEALEIFQQVANLTMTGVLDEKTMEKMHAKRCGEKDIMGKGDMMRRRRKRYALADTKWSGRVGYNYVNYPKLGGISSAKTEKVIDKAFQTWSEQAKLSFTKKTSQSDIEISFVTRDHGDNNPLDGRGRTLAHAFYPSTHRLGGDMHFDDEENWAVDGGEGTDLYYVALHELGHSLGLGHSLDMDAVMYAYYPGYNKDLKLQTDDINGIRALYGSRLLEPPSAATTPPPHTPSEEAGKFCNNGTVDAAGTLGGKLYVFQGSQYAELDDHGIVTGYPRNIQDDWNNLATDLDAALSLEKYNMILFFKDGLYWRYEMNEEGLPVLVRGYPRLIYNDFKGGLPDEVHAAFTWSSNGRIFIVKGSDYYRVSGRIEVYPDRMMFMCAKWYFTYPKNFDDRWNIDSDILSDATEFHGRTFFFGEKNYFRYNDLQLKADDGYPMVTSEHWFGCQPPGALEVPDMEMDMMEDATQFEEISVGLYDLDIASASTVVSMVTSQTLLIALVGGLLAS